MYYLNKNNHKLHRIKHLENLFFLENVISAFLSLSYYCIHTGVKERNDEKAHIVILHRLNYMILFYAEKVHFTVFLCLKSKTFSSKNKQKNEMFKVQFCRTQLQQPNNNRLNEYEKGRNGQKLNEIKNTNK